MIKIIAEKPKRILLLEKQLESELKVKISNKGREFSLDGTPEREYFAEKIILAIDFGFEHSDAMLLNDEDFLFEVLNIKDYTKKDNLERIRGRIIGTERKTLDTLEQLTDCFFQLRNNQVAIIGPSERIKYAQEAIINLVKGTKQANVYARLEKHRPEPILDLGLKEKFKKANKNF
ncbi:MAG: hypothetical protein AABX48_01630 [Nanoarchaeota archaeon]